MARKTINRIREKTRLQQYDMTVHAMEEMAEENLGILDIEHTILRGKVGTVLISNWDSTEKSFALKRMTPEGQKRNKICRGGSC